MASSPISTTGSFGNYYSYRSGTGPANSEDTVIPGSQTRKDGSGPTLINKISKISKQNRDSTPDQGNNIYPENLKNRSYNGTEKINGEKTGEHDTDGKKSGIKEKKKDGTEYTEQELKQLKSLKSRDIEVKAHEQAHIAAGGQYVRSGAHYQYQTGPDGNRYAVGGEVEIDSSKISNDPQGTITKMETIIRSALAPAEPSGQDRAVAAQAQKIEIEAREELMKTQSSKLFLGKQDKQDKTEENNSNTPRILGDKTQKDQTHINIYV